MAHYSFPSHRYLAFNNLTIDPDVSNLLALGPIPGNNLGLARIDGRDVGQQDDLSIELMADLTAVEAPRCPLAAHPDQHQLGVDAAAGGIS